MAPIKLTIAYGSASAGDLIERASAEHGRVRVEPGCRWRQSNRHCRTMFVNHTGSEFIRTLLRPPSALMLFIWRASASLSQPLLSAPGKNPDQLRPGSSCMSPAVPQSSRNTQEQPPTSSRK
jgi:hypothetical protein